MSVGPGQRRRRAALAGSLIAAAIVATSAAACAVAPADEQRVLRQEIEAVAPAELREQDNPTRDPRVLNALWGDALLRRTTPLMVRPSGRSVPAAAPAQGLLVTAARAPQFRMDGSPTTVATADRGFARSVTGRLFFTMNSQPRSCTATVVASSSRAVIATAGHCLYSVADTGPRTWAQNLMFIPGYTAGAGPVGRWFADTAPEAVVVTTGWQQRQDWAEDVGFVRLGRRGFAVQDVTGGLGVAFDIAPPAGAGLEVLGYPAAAPYDGARLQGCSSATGATASGVSNGGAPDPVDPAALSSVCPMTAGYSGGPWLTGTRPDVIVGISSHDLAAGTVYGARPGAGALDAFRRVDTPS